MRMTSSEFLRLDRSPKHPAEGMGKAAVEAFNRLCTSQEPEASRRTMDTLIAAGLVEQIGERVMGWDAIGPITLPIYAVPYRHHMAWCQWGTGQMSKKNSNRSQRRTTC